MRWITVGAALAAALLMPASARAQRFIAITFEIGTANDSATFVDLDQVERSGDLATALAYIEQMEPYRLPNGVGLARRQMRIQFDCRCNEMRMVLVNRMTDIATPAQFAAAPAQAVRADSATATGMCKRPGALKPLWPLLNSEFREAPEKRKVLTSYAQTHPWGGQIGRAHV